MKKILVATTIAVMVGTTNTGFAFGIPGIGGIGKIFGGLGGGNSSSDSASSVDFDGLTSHQQRMLDKLATSTLLFSAARLDVCKALALDPGIISEQELRFTDLSRDRTNEGYQKASASTKVPAKEIKAAAKAALDSGDQEKINQINDAIRGVEIKKSAAHIYNGFAIKDAVDVIKEATAGMKGLSAIGKIQGLIKSARLAQQLCNDQNNQIKALDEALKEYKASQNIAEPTQEEALAAGDSWAKG